MDIFQSLTISCQDHHSELNPFWEGFMTAVRQMPCQPFVAHSPVPCFFCLFKEAFAGEGIELRILKGALHLCYRIQIFPFMIHTAQNPTRHEWCYMAHVMGLFSSKILWRQNCQTYLIWGYHCQLDDRHKYVPSEQQQRLSSWGID